MSRVYVDRNDYFDIEHFGTHESAETGFTAAALVFVVVTNGHNNNWQTYPIVSSVHFAALDVSTVPEFIVRGVILPIFSSIFRHRYDPIALSRSDVRRSSISTTDICALCNIPL